MQTAVIYFSRAAENYFSGRIVRGQEGNTKLSAKQIAALLHAPCLEIKPAAAYPEVYRQCTAQAEEELKREARPALSSCPDIAPYERIVLCCPCWWGTFPRPAATFLESQDFAGRTIIPVCEFSLDLDRRISAVDHQIS